MTIAIASGDWMDYRADAYGLDAFRKALLIAPNGKEASTAR